MPDSQPLVRLSGVGRLYVDPEPERGAHWGYRGEIAVDACGVHLGPDCEVLTVDNESQKDEWPMGNWSIVERAQIVPWHRVHSLEWDDDDA